MHNTAIQILQETGFWRHASNAKVMIDGIIKLNVNQIQNQLQYKKIG